MSLSLAREKTCKLCVMKITQQEITKEERFRQKQLKQQKDAGETPNTDILGNELANMVKNLLICTTCHRMMHIKCLRFDEDMLKTICGYGWQCDECKKCHGADLRQNF